MQKRSLWFAVSNGEPFVCHAFKPFERIGRPNRSNGLGYPSKKNLHPFALDGFTSSGFELGFDHWGTICPLGYNFRGHFHF